MIVKLLTYKGTLYIAPALDELKHELSYVYRFMPDEEVRFRRNGQIQTVKRLGSKVQTEVRLLYEELDGILQCPAGLRSRVEATLRNLGLEFQHVHRGQYPEFKIVPGETVRDLYREQKDCVASLLSVPGGAMAQAPTGAGKTRVIAGLIRAYRGKRIVVATKAASVVDTLYHTLSEVLKDDEIEVGMYCGSTKFSREVTVSTIDLLHYFDPEEVDVLIFDEAHRAGADKTSKLVGRFCHGVKYGLSATLKDRFDGKEKFLEGLFGPLVFELTDKEAEDLGRIAPIKAWIMNVPEGPMISETANRIKREEIGIWLNPQRNKIIAEVCQKAPKEQQLVVFVRTVEHAEHLHEEYLPDFEVYHAKLPTKVKRDLKKRFESGELKRLIATNALSEGVDPGNLYIVVDANWEASEVSVVQKAGRNRRFAKGSNKPYGVVIGFDDDWNEKMARKAKDRTKRYKNRDYSVFENATPKDVDFVKLDTLPNE